MGVFLYLAPERAIDLWPWALTPLTARSTAAIFFLGIAGAGVFFDRRWQAVRIPLQVAMVMLALILVSVARDWDSVDTDKAFTWVLLAGFVAVLVGSAVLYRKMTGAGLGTGQSVRLKRATATTNTTVPRAARTTSCRATGTGHPIHVIRGSRAVTAAGDRSRWENTTWRMGWTA